MNPRFLSDNIVDASLVLDFRTTMFVGVAGGRCLWAKLSISAIITFSIWSFLSLGDLETEAGDVPMEVVKVAGDAPTGDALKIHIKAYGDYAQMSKESRDGILTAGVDLSDLEHPALVFIMLITGDGDFVRSLLALRDLGYCTILVYKELSASPPILKVDDLDIYWRDLATGFLEVPLLYWKSLY
ncbi:hypothetical protein Tco_0533092 [Tanacetum coccineum]